MLHNGYAPVGGMPNLNRLVSRSGQQRDEAVDVEEARPADAVAVAGEPVGRVDQRCAQPVGDRPPATLILRQLGQGFAQQSAALPHLHHCQRQLVEPAVVLGQGLGERPAIAHVFQHLAQHGLDGPALLSAADVQGLRQWHAGPQQHRQIVPQLGQRVLTTDWEHNASAFDGELSAGVAVSVFGEEEAEPAVDPRTWRLVELAMPNPDGSDDIIAIRSLRTLTWLAETGCEAGQTMWYVLQEMGLSGLATVQSVEPCPPIEDGPGRVVLSTVTNLNGNVLRIWLDGLDEPLEPTRRHRLYSEDRGEWVPAGELAVGDRLRTLSGPAEITRIASKPGIHRVYNIEVETEHCYYVSAGGVLSHNTNPCGARVLQTGGNTIRNSTARGLNESLGVSHHRRDWGRALELMKSDNGLPSSFHQGKILSDGNVLNSVTEALIGNLLDYVN